MLKKLKSIGKKIKEKIKGIFKGGDKKKKKPIKTEPPKIDEPIVSEPTKPGDWYDAGTLDRDKSKAQTFYINMLSGLEGEVNSNLLHQAKMAILFANEDELDELMDMLGDNGFDDWKDFYYDNRSGRLLEDEIADIEAKLEQIIKILS